jgi:hypothetical protein
MILKTILKILVLPERKTFYPQAEEWKNQESE